MHVLFLTPRFPHPPLKGDTLRVYNQLRVLSKRHRITLLSVAEAPVDRPSYERVADLCERVSVVTVPAWRAAANLAAGVASRLPMQVLYYRASLFEKRLDAILTSGGFDVVHATLIRMLPYVWTLDRPPVVVDLIDSLTLNLADRRDGISGPKRLAYELEYRRVREYERAVVRRFPALVVSSDADRELLAGMGDERRPPIDVIPNGVDLEHFAFHDQEGRDTDTLVFTGNMGYHPNEEAALWFARQVWPSLREGRPGLRFHIVGANPGARIRALATPGSGLDVLGRVPEVSSWLAKATVAVCPMRSGSGMQNKVLEAMAAGAPVVATSIANRGVKGVPGRDLLVADSPRELAASITRLLDRRDVRAHLARSARTFAEENFSWERHGSRLSALYSSVLG